MENNRPPCHASLQLLTDCSLYSLPAADSQKITGKWRHIHIFHRIFAALAKKSAFIWGLTVMANPRSRGSMAPTCIAQKERRGYMYIHRFLKFEIRFKIKVILNAFQYRSLRVNMDEIGFFRKATPGME